ESTIKLAIQIVPVRDHDNSRVVHLWRRHDYAGVKAHRYALARSLCVPDNTGLAITVDGAKRAFDRFFNGVILVIGGDLLNCPSVLLKQNEVSQVVKQQIAA